MSQSAASLPAGLATRYGSPRRLRTRATGTSFWVRAENGNLIVTTSSGSERSLELRHLEACWPFVADDAPMSKWKHLSGDNASYIGAIYDDLSSLEPPLEVTELARPEGVEAPAPPPTNFREVRSIGPGAMGTHEETNRKIPLDLPFDARLAIGLRDEEIEDLKREIARLRGGPGPSRIQAELQLQLSAMARELGEARAETARARAEAAASAEEIGKVQQAARRAIREAIREAKVAPATVRPSKKPASAQREVARLEREVARLERELAVAQTDVEAARDELRKMRTRQGILLELDGVTSRSQAELTVDDAIAGPLIQASTKIVSEPLSAIVDSRRALETFVALTWGRAFGLKPSGIRRPTSVLLAELRGNPQLPESDWHLAKNLYGRSSGVIHEGGATPQLAMWVWLGMVQLADSAGPAPRKDA